MFRRPKTLGELKELAVIEDVGLHPRRTKRAIPTDRWDIAPSTAGNRSWKRARRTQYKED